MKFTIVTDHPRHGGTVTTFDVESDTAAMNVARGMYRSFPQRVEWNVSVYRGAPEERGEFVDMVGRRSTR